MPRARTWRRLVGDVGGIGLLPVAPGTWASIATAVVFAWLFGVHGWRAAQPVDGLSVMHASPAAVRVAVSVVLLLLLALGIAVGNHAPGDWGAEDPGSFVLDEVVGQGLALLPLLPGPMRWQGALAALVCFRLFDITKPPPCGRLERLHGGLGIMADDVAAGVYAAAVVTGLRAVGWLPA